MEVKVVRNVDFHRKYFALIAYAGSSWNEQEKEGIKEGELPKASSRRAEVIFHPASGVRYPPSLCKRIIPFPDLYGRVKDVIFSIIGDRVTQEEFETVN